MADVKPASSTTTSGAVVRGASLLIVLQVGARAATFVANQLLLRFLTAQLLGVATQLEVYYLSVLFFGRESLRVAIQRQGGREGGGGREEGKKQKGQSSSQSAVNLAYISVLLGTLVALLLGWLYLASVGSGSNNSNDKKDTTDAVVDTPFFLAGLYLYAAAAVLELLSEPAFVVLQLRLRFGARAAAESVATALRCAVTLGTAIVAVRQDFDAGVLPFALGQLAYGAGLLVVYGWRGAALARQDGFSLLPARLSPSSSSSASSASSASSTAAGFFSDFFDRPTLQLAGSMAAQSVVKHLLTQGDTFLVSVLSTPAAQGVYALANNYGGLAARLLFQPIEESSRSYFSRLLADNDVMDKNDNKNGKERYTTAARDLQTLLRVYILFSLVLTALGPSAAAPFLSLVTGPRWAGSGAAATLAAYVWYIPLLAANGVAEAFVASVASEADVHRQSAWMGGFSLVFAAAGFACLRLLDWGAAGLVAANAINMTCRILWSAVFIRRYFAAREVPFSLSVLAPTAPTVLAAAVAGGVVQRLVGQAAAVPEMGAMAQIVQLAKIAAVGLPLVLAV